MKHSIVFKNSENHWDNGIPLGNGCFGTMVYFEKNTLFMPMNHYEVYYNIEKYVLPEDKLSVVKDAPVPGAGHEERLRIANESVAPEGEPFSLYRGHRNNEYKKERYCGNHLSFFFTLRMQNLSLI